MWRIVLVLGLTIILLYTIYFYMMNLYGKFSQKELEERKKEEQQILK